MTSLLRVPFHDDETVTSFLSRTARANGRGALLPFLMDVGINPRLVSLGDATEVGRLEKCLDFKAGNLVSRAVVVGENGRRHFGGNLYSKAHLVRTKLRICLRCLAEDELDTGRMPGTRRYGRTIWMFTNIASCHIHGCALHEHNFRSVRNCSYDFLSALEAFDVKFPKAAATIVEQPSTEFEAFVRDRVDGVVNHGDVLDGLSLMAASDLCMVFGVALTFGKGQTLKIPADQKRLATNSGYLRLREGEAALRGALGELVLQPPMRRHHGLISLYGSPYTLAFHQKESQKRGNDFSRIRELIQEHSLEGLPSSPTMRLPDGESRWTTMYRISKAVGMPECTVKSYLVGCELRDGVSLIGKRGFIDGEVGKQSIEALTDTTVLMGLRDTLGWTDVELRNLHACGILKPRIPVLPNGFRARFSISEMRELKERLLWRCGKEKPGMLTMAQAVRFTEIRVADVLRMVFDGDLATLAYSERGALHQGLKVDPAEVRMVFERRRKSSPGAAK